MEPISFSLALGSIPRIFLACVDCYRYIQFGRDFEQDFGMTFCQLEASKLRLNRWVTAIGIEGPDSQLRANLYGEHEIKSAYYWLKEIQKAFNTTLEIFSGSKNATRPDELLLVNRDTAIDAASEPLKHLHKTMRRIIDGRLKTRKRDQIAWAVYKKESYENLVGKISELVSNLTELFPTTAYHSKHLCEKEVNDMSSDSLRLLGNIISNQDEVLQHAIRNELNKRTIRVGSVRMTDDFLGQIRDDVISTVRASDIDVTPVDRSGRAILHIGSNVGTESTTFKRM